MRATDLNAARRNGVVRQPPPPPAGSHRTASTAGPGSLHRRLRLMRTSSCGLPSSVEVEIAAAPTATLSAGLAVVVGGGSGTASPPAPALKLAPRRLELIASSVVPGF